MTELPITDLTDNAALGRFEMNLDGHTAVVSYRRQGDILTLVHTEVPRVLGGRGIGSLLASAVLDLARHRGLRVTPECGFMAAFIKRHTEYADLVAPNDAP